MPRVLLTGFCAVPGPHRAGVQLRHVVRALTPMCTMDLLVLREGEQGYVERQGLVRILRVPVNDGDLRAQIQAFQRALKRQLDGADYDVVHCRDSWSCIPVLEARARLGYAVVYDLARSSLGESTLDAELDAQYGRDEEACLLAADLVLAPTPAAVTALGRRGRPERVKLSPPGVDVDRFDWDDVSAPGPARIVYAGTLDPTRGLRVLFKAMALIVREVDARLVLAGARTASFTATLESWIAELGLAGKVELLGAVDHEQVPTLLSTAAVCVVPAASDLSPNPMALFPTKLLEYMACRCAIVAPRRETVGHVLENNLEALLFEPGDVADLARKVVRLLREPELRAELAQAAYERVRRGYTASAARRALRSAYDTLAARFADPPAAPAPVAPKLELLTDDEYEPTVFEEPPRPRQRDTGLEKLGELDDALASLDNTSSQVVALPVPSEADETMERAAVPPSSHDDAPWTVAAPPGRAPTDDWVVTNVSAAIEELEISSSDEGTPIEGVIAAAPPLPIVGNFVAGEIDVPTPPPEATAASEAETGSRISTVPIDRR